MKKEELHKLRPRLEKIEEENKHLRELLWLNHGCHASLLYGDDGEMQCSKCIIDFRRDSPNEIEMKFLKINNPEMYEKMKIIKEINKITAYLSDILSISS